MNSHDDSVIDASVSPCVIRPYMGFKTVSNVNLMWRWMDLFARRCYGISRCDKF